MPDPQPLAFADLDDTLFQSRRKMKDTAIHRQVAVASTGDPRKSSFMTVQQSTLYEWLRKTTELIPVTARSSASFDRVELRFPSWAIVSNGALILEPNGKAHQPWSARVKDLLHPQMDVMQFILDQGRSAAKKAGIDVRSWIVEEAELATYVVFKLNDINDLSIAALEALPIPVKGWTRHFNSETLAMIPPGSGKAAAVDYLQTRLNPNGARPVLGFGDSLSDLSFMTKTDIMMIPSNSQIARSL